MIFKPLIIRRIVFFYMNVLLFSHCPVVGLVKGLINAFGKLCPDMFANHLCGITVKNFTGFFIHVGIAPVIVQGYKRIRNSLKNVSDIFGKFVH